MSTRLQAEQARLLDMKRERDEARAEVERQRTTLRTVAANASEWAKKCNERTTERDAAVAQRDALREAAKRFLGVYEDVFDSVKPVRRGDPDERYQSDEAVAAQRALEHVLAALEEGD